MQDSAFFISLIAMYVAIMVAIYAGRKRKRKPLTPVPNADRAAVEPHINSLLETLNTSGKWEEAGGAMFSTNFDYQGGHFALLFNGHSEVARLTYLFFYSTPLDNINAVRTLINKCNMTSDLCHLVYICNERDATIDLHCVSTFIYTKSLSAAQLQCRLHDIFTQRNTFVHNISEAIALNNKAQYHDVDADGAVQEFELSLIREQEIKRQACLNDVRFDKDKRLTIRMVMHEIASLPDFTPISLTVLAADGQKTAVSLDQIETFDIASAIIRDGAFTGNDAMMLLVYADPSTPTTQRQMSIALHKEQATADTLYFRATMTIAPLSAAPHLHYGSSASTPEVYTTLAAVDLVSPSQQKAKFDYLWTDAVQAKKNGKTPDDEDMDLLCNCMDNGLAYEVYAGKTLFHQKRYAEAIAYLKPAFDNLKLRANDRQPANSRLYIEVCHTLGLCYSQLGCHRLAIYYQQINAHIPFIPYMEAYINSMVACDDSRAMPYINEALNNMRETLANLDDEDHSNERQQIEKFQAFTIRSKVHLLADIGRYDEAEALLRPLIGSQADGNMALNELAYIIYKRQLSNK